MRSRVGSFIFCFSAIVIGIASGSHLGAQITKSSKTKTSQGTSKSASKSQVSAPVPGLVSGPSVPSGTSQDATDDLSVGVGKSILVDTAQKIQRVAIGLGDVAQAQAINPTEIMINGKTPGETSLIIWEVGGGRQFFNISVRPVAAVTNDRLDIVRRELKTALPGQMVKVSTDSTNIFVSGTVKDLASSDRAMGIANTAGKAVNLLYVEVPRADPQILLKVRFASFDHNLEKQLGINFFSTGFGNTVAAVNTGQYSPPGISLPSEGTAATATVTSPGQIFAFLPGMNLGATLEALESKGIVQVLAEPNVMATNGKQASFLAGGEYPYPIVQGTSAGGAGAVTITFKEYGVRLTFLPTVTARGTIRLQVAPEVSSLDFANAVEIGGFDVPAINTRKMKTEVELSDGQSFAISGLLDNRDTEAYEKIPFLGSIPILGKLFTSMQKTRTNTELIVIVTPEIVSPIEVGASLPQIKFPTKFLPPNSGVPMNTPDAKTAANTMAPAPASMPVEKLIETMKPEPTMTVDSGGVVFGQGGGGGAAATGNTTPAPVTTNPQ